MFKSLLFILLALSIPNSSCITDELYEAGILIWNLYSLLDKIHRENTTNAARLREIFTLGNSRNYEVKIQIDKIFKKLDQIEEFMNPKIISNSLKLLPSKLILHASVTGLELSVQDIDNHYKEFQKYITEEFTQSDYALGELIRKTIVDIEGDITWIRSLIIEENVSLLNHKNVVGAISADAVRLRDQLCDGPQLTSSILAQLFRMVVIAEIKVSLMVSLAHIYRYWKNDGWVTLNSFAVEKFQEYFARYVTVFSLNMDATDSLYLRACDPANDFWIRDSNFYELEGTIQTTIFNYHWTPCKYSSCNDIWSHAWTQCPPLEYDRRSSCSHTIARCAYLGAIKTCVLRNGPYKFQYMNSTQLGALGTNFECPRDNGYIIEGGRGLDFIYGACACDCYGDMNKICLSIIESRVESNWTITALRFFRKDGILYIQPKEGKLQTNGYISRNQRWIPIPTNPQLHTINKENRRFFLEDLRLPPYYALTGVKFNKVTRGTVTGFAIEIIGTAFDYESGTFLLKNDFRISAGGSNINTWSDLSFQKVPSTYALIRHTPNATAFQYVSLEKSKLSFDFGQSTLPFFDAVPIVTNPPSILGGIGIFHKGTEGYAGFISLRVFGISYKIFLSDFENEAIVNGRVSFNTSEHH